MSRVRSDIFTNKEGTGAPTFESGLNVTGVLTATSFSGNVSGDATGLSGTPDITVNNIVGAALTLSGDLTVNGTQTIINTAVLDVADKTIGIASVSSPTDNTADGAGIVIYGATNKSLTWSNTYQNFALVGGGISATTYEGNFVLDSFLFN